jgi:hypothetical protein
MNHENTVMLAAAEESLIELAVEAWRFSRVFARAINKLDAGDVGRFAGQHRYFLRKIEDSLACSGLALVSVEGEKFDAGMAVSALNLGDFGPDDALLVDQMMEPIVMGRDGLRRPGTVMLRKLHP